MNTTQKIALRKAEAKFTRWKQKVTEDPSKEAGYQKAKRELAALRISLRGHTPHGNAGDGVAKPVTLKVKGTPKGSG